jgi:DnaJ-class molecular chaperone
MSELHHESAPEPLTHTEDCPRCKGTGSIEVPAHGSWEEWGTVYAECPRCRGLGWVDAA